MKNENQTIGLVTGPRLLEILFPDKKSRPSYRWLEENKKAGVIPHKKLGRLLRFDVEEVKAAINEQSKQAA